MPEYIPFQDPRKNIIFWSSVGGGFLLIIILISICCAIKRRFTTTEFPPLYKSVNSINQTHYDSFRTFTDYLINIEEIRTTKTLGEGSFGQVLHGYYRGSDVAVKKMKLSLDIREDSDMFISEVLTLSKLRNQNIVQFIGVSISTNEGPCIIMEFMQGGSVADVIHKQMKILDWKTRLKWALHAAKGMEFLHANKPQPIIHRDLKSDNLLVCENGLVKVGDFGTAKLLEKITNMKSGLSRRKKRLKRDTIISSFEGTVCWAAPEVVPPKPPKTKGKYTTAADVYSYGITFWEMITNRRPYRGYKFEYEIMDAIIMGVRPEIPQDCPPVIFDLIQECWDQDIAIRPTFPQIHRKLDRLMDEVILNEGTVRKTYPPRGHSLSNLALLV